MGNMGLKHICQKYQEKSQPHWPNEVEIIITSAVYPIEYVYGFVGLCFVEVILSVLVDSCDLCNHILQGCFTGTGAIMWLPQCQWSNPEGYGWNQLLQNFSKHNKVWNMCIFHGKYFIQFYKWYHCRANERRSYKVTPSLIGWAQT